MKNIIATALYIIALCFVMIGCKGEDGADGANSQSYQSQPVDAVSESYSMSGYGQDGPYPYGSFVNLIPLDSNLNQLGTGGFITFTDSDFGSYARDFSFPGQYVQAFIQGNPYDEITGQLMSFKVLTAIVDLSDDTEKNINPSTTMKASILKHLFNHDNSTDSMPSRFTNSANEAESRVLNCFGMPSIGSEHFENMDIAQTDKVDAVGLAISTILIGGNPKRTVAEQMELMQLIIGQLKYNSDCDTAMKNKLRNDGANLDIIKIRDNLESRYTSLGYPSYKSPPFYNHLDSDQDGIRNDEDPDSYIELLTEIHEIKYHDQLNVACSMSDSAQYRYFSIPYVFPQEISTAKWLGTNISGDRMSIYTADTNGTVDTSDDTAGELIESFDKIPVDYFSGSFLDSTGDTFSNLPNSFVASIDGNSIPIGTNVFIVMDRGGSLYNQSGLCSSSQVKFGRNQFTADATVDSSTTWQGVNPPQSASLFTRNWVKIFITD